MASARSSSKLFRALGPRLNWPIPADSHGAALRHGIRALEKLGVPRGGTPAPLPEHPYDGLLLRQSKLYRRSRELYRKVGGEFRATLVTSPRTLSSPILVEPMIEYSPTERELVWAATDPVERRDEKSLLRVRGYTTSLFHEQNHRILWRELPPPPPASQRGALRRYQNFAESLIVATDMALGDELGARVAPFFYLLGTVYDPGTSIGSEGLSRRAYRNYLQAATLGTYLTLELYSEEYVEQVLRAFFPALGRLATRAAQRAGRLDPQFINLTNPLWQQRFSGLLARRLARPGEAPLILADDPTQNPQQYVIAERWFAKFGL